MNTASGMTDGAMGEEDMHIGIATGRALEARARSPRATHASEIDRVLGSEGVHAALQLLNTRTRFRYTGLYHVDPPLLRNIHLFDRENPGLNVSGTVSPLTIGYCGIACSTGAPFVTSDSRKDPRLESHPARESMISYCGVPIRSRGGIPWGTLCHFDFRRRLASPDEAALLETLVPVFAGWLIGQGLLT